MLISMEMKLMLAKRTALFSMRKLAKGMEVIASNPTMKANQMMYSSLSGYFKNAAMEGAKKLARNMKTQLVAMSDNITVLYTLGFSSCCRVEQRKKAVSIP